MQHTSNEKISEALKLLEAAAEQKKEELKSLLSDKYAHLRDFIVETQGGLVKSVSDAGKQAFEETAHAKDFGVEKAYEFACDVERNVRSNPWRYLAGTAAVSLLFGYILGRNHK